VPATFTTDADGVIVRMPEALVAAWPSGFVTVMVRAPVAALARTVILMMIFVWFEKVMLLMATPPPFTTAVRWLAKPGPPVSGPGSKNSDPEMEVPVMTTLVADWPCGRLAGEALVGVAGGGARS
jgi:hypothetical protein